MNKKISLYVLALLVASILGGAASSQETRIGESSQVVQAVPSMEPFDPQNFTKLEISPRYGNAQVQPGEERELTVTIKNKETTSITVAPLVQVPPYGEYLMDSEWIIVSPANVEISAGGSQKFAIRVIIPEDASIGYYNANIAFTDEKIPTPYPELFPNYVHSYSLSINVWAPPKIQISNPYINDQIEAGKEYDYKIKVKNTGDKAVAIEPKMSQQNQMYGPYGMMESAFSDDAVTITSPKEIPAGGSIEVNVHVKVPANAKGNYQGGIDLGIDDPAIRDEWADMVTLAFGVWKQPAEPYVKTFNAQEAAPVTIEVSSNLFGGVYGYYASGIWTNNKKDPSFAVTLTGSDNTAIPLKKVRTIIKGGVSLGGMNGLPPWESESEGIYQEMGAQYIETYEVEVPAGDLKLGIMPQNTQQFEYTITMGND